MRTAMGKIQYTPGSNYPYSTVDGANTSYPIKKKADHTPLGDYFYICNLGDLKLNKILFI